MTRRVRWPVSRPVRVLALALGALLTVALTADVLVPPATRGQPVTIYVDARIGDDDNDGRMPEQPLETLPAAVRVAEAAGTDDGADDGPRVQILVMGYGHQLVYTGTRDRCVTLTGTPEHPVVIRRNSYTNTLYPAVLTANADVTGAWELVEERTVPRPGGETAAVRTWATDWPERIRLEDEPLDGFIKLGGITVPGYRTEPPERTTEAAWWADGQLYLRHDHYDPNDFPILVKNGDALCLSGDSAHVRVVDLSVDGAVHAIRVEDGAVDVRVEHIFRVNVLDPDFRADLGERSGGGG